MPTWQLTVLLWIIIGSTVAGLGVLVVVATPQLNANAMSLIPAAAIGGYLVALIPSWIIAVRLRAPRPA